MTQTLKAHGKRQRIRMGMGMRIRMGMGMGMRMGMGGVRMGACSSTLCCYNNHTPKKPIASKVQVRNCYGRTA